MEQRKMMLAGNRPSECEYCWKIEDSPGENTSDRFIKSTDDWAYDKLDETLTAPWDSFVKPTYLEVTFSSECNLNCAYCVADVSSSIAREMEKFGPYPGISDSHRNASSPDLGPDNPYIQAFWKWFPEISNTLKVFRITGGEPLLSSNTFKILEYLENNPNPNLELILNSNLSYSQNLLEKFLSHIKVLLAKKAIKKFAFYTSLDGHGPQSAYIRRGLDFERFKKNLNILFESLPSSEIVIMCTFNILSVGSFAEMLKWIHGLKNDGKNLILDISYLKDPDYLRANLMDESLVKMMDDNFVLMNNLGSFSTYEIKKLERILNWVQSSKDDPSNKRIRAKFYLFVNEFDRRFNSNFSNTFPEYRPLYQMGKKAAVWMNLFQYFK